ncbi:hypothetical protein [Candidatus Palauibacter sp.]|uniref:hypothetical protein n=1 Tax=Candidatus Palauibacter sp. TaxID=3101350 RepID=UPI003B5C9280
MFRIFPTTVVGSLRPLCLAAIAGASLCGSGLAAAQDHTIIALSHSDFTAYELDPATGRIVNQFTAENQPHEAVVTPDGGTIFVAIPRDPPYVVILDAATFEETGRIESEHFHRPPESRQLGPEVVTNQSALPHGVALNRAGTKLYVGVEWSEVPGLVVYDVSRGEVSGKIDLLLEGGHFLAIDPRTDKLYYPHRDDDRVVVIDTSTDEIVKIIDVPGGPVGVDFTPDGEAWVHSDYDGTVTVIDTSTDEVLETIDTGGRGAGRISVSPDGRFAASTRNDTENVALIDVEKREVTGHVTLGPGPGFPLFSPDGSKLYVMNSGGADVAVIDVGAGGAGVVAARHPVGVNPFGGTLRHLPSR